MPKKKRPELTDQERAKRLKETAREIEADETGKEFERTMRSLAPKQKPRTKA